jgi:hypothetical protein
MASAVWASGEGTGNDYVSVAIKVKPLTVTSNTLCFSFGSGSWEEGSEAKTLIEDLSGAWLSFSVDVHTPVTFEIDVKASNIEEQIKEYATKKKDEVLEMGDLLIDLESFGEAPFSPMSQYHWR